MKSIIYILIAVFVGSIILSAIPNNAKKGQTYSIHSVDNNFTLNQLIESAEIINSRFKDYGLQDYLLALDESSATLKLTLNNSIESKSLASLITSKGKVEFFETYDRKEFLKKYKADAGLKSILNIPTGEEYSGILGHCRPENRLAVDEHLSYLCKAKLEFNINFCWSEQTNEEGDYSLFLLQSEASLNNSFIWESEVKTDMPGDKPGLMFTFNNSGAAIWSEMTKNNMNRVIAIVFDNHVLSAPVVRSEIQSGKCMITGNFTLDEVKRLNALIGNEELPLKLEISRQAY